MSGAGLTFRHAAGAARFCSFCQLPRTELIIAALRGAPARDGRLADDDDVKSR